ncbi:RPB5 subunit of DNA-directed RNA polymerase [Aaosphaeria arxii CBS 175.79]|uniref:DNA-directed RNA polymerases I, II, and III subunit RPABC1 n=1 Tax=Aaosphaeria arxii CBS 175.79 TaxID=1450172 RepID=A0A6A5XGL7_9PLEO|nr:RPB5 subunit of DNA-directed RNA polymerase [Aaosphaeria arxii CBS 175.79]KAF2012328.1 RPB5 subunit of DNA-directed RNA polymerase [Aaosphaeria arxii CBS 175.79]
MDSQAQYTPGMVRMWRIYRTTKQMCRDRGYDIPVEDTEISLEEFAHRCRREDGEPERSQLHYSATPTQEMIHKYTPPATAKFPNPEPQIGSLWVEFNADENAGLKQLREYMVHLAQNNHYSGILVTIKPMTGMAIRMLRNATGVDGQVLGGVEVFVEQDLLVNITKHELVPRHILLSHEEKKQLLERYRLKETQLPRIQVTDPVAKYLGLRRGQVVKIIRMSETAGRYASYRWAI